MDFVVFEEQFLFGVLIQIITGLHMLRVHLALQSVKALANCPQRFVELRLDDELVVVKGFQVDCRLDHVLKSHECGGVLSQF